MDESPQWIPIAAAEAPSVDQQPTVSPVHWRAVGENDGTRYLLMLLPHDFPADDLERVRVRRTSPIALIDPALGVVTTQSGRRYWLASPPSWDETLVAAMRLHVDSDLANFSDVSQQVWAEVRSCQSGY